MSKQPPLPSPTECEHAKRAALDITKASPVVQGCLTTLIFSRQLFDATRALMEAEIREGWDVDNPDLVIYTLMGAAHNKGVQLVSAQELHTTCITTILPFVDTLLQLQRAAESGADGASATQGESEHVELSETAAAVGGELAGPAAAAGDAAAE